jgi:hypothetical protein
VPGIASANNAKRRPAEFAQERLIELRDDSTRVGVAGQRLDTRNNLAEKALTDVADALLYPARIALRSASADSVNRMVIFAGMWLFQTEACLRVCERYLPASIKVRGRQRPPRPSDLAGHLALGIAQGRAAHFGGFFEKWQFLAPWLPYLTGKCGFT